MFRSKTFLIFVLFIIGAFGSASDSDFEKLDLLRSCFTCTSYTDSDCYDLKNSSKMETPCFVLTDRVRLLDDSCYTYEDKKYGALFRGCTSYIRKPEDPCGTPSHMCKFCNGDNCNNQIYDKSAAARTENIPFGLISAIISIYAAAYWNQ